MCGWVVHFVALLLVHSCAAPWIFASYEYAHNGGAFAIVFACILR